MKKICSMLLVLALMSCADTYDGDTPLRGPAYQTRFNVNKITVTSNYYAPGTAPYIDHLMRVTPDRMLRDWLRAKFVVGDTTSPYRLDVFIREASMTQKPGIRYGRTEMTSPVYRANVSIEIKVIRDGSIVGAVFANTFEERISNVNISAEEREDILENLAYTAIEKADSELDIGINRYLGSYIQ